MVELSSDSRAPRRAVTLGEEPAVKDGSDQSFTIQ